MRSSISTTTLHLALFIAMFVAAGRAEESPYQVRQTPPKSAEAALRCFQVRPGFRVEIAAAEPLVTDPIAIAWGPDGKLWVVEMGDYPLDLGQSAPTAGQVRYLEDSNQDGQYDQSTVFIDGLAFPTGVMPWRDGVLITCAPDILYAEDIDGDGRADKRQVLFTGFGLGNPQHRVNSLRWGLDSWVHCANGDSGGTVLSVKTGERVDIYGQDVRMRPDEGRLETATGMTQFGRCRDDWGNWFGGNNSFAFWHCVVQERYLRRNRFFLAPDPCVHLMSPAANAPVFPSSSPLPRLNELGTGNRLTSACGREVYRDDLFGPDFDGSYFVCEPAHNLVHCQIMYRSGTTFASRRAGDEQQSEFLASSDVWFRPTQAITGPDGALWIVDMYRLVIEHPEYITESLQPQLDFGAGTNKGRIYRVVPIGREPRPIQRLDLLETTQLVHRIDTSNGPQRDLAHQLIVQRADTAAVTPLAAIVIGNQHAKRRLSALCALGGLGAVEPHILSTALDDPHAAVRRHAVRLAESRVAEDRSLQETLLRLADDPDAQVQLQVACSMGEWLDARAGRALARIALRESDDPLMHAAVMSSATEHLPEMVDEVLRASLAQHGPPALMTDLLLLAMDSEQPRVLARGLNGIAVTHAGGSADWPMDVLAGLLDIVQYRGLSLVDLRERGDDELATAIDALEEMFREARRVAAAPQEPVDDRVRAASFLGQGIAEHVADVQLLTQLLDPDAPTRLQLAAVTALGRLERDDVPESLLNSWSYRGADVWFPIVDTLLSRENWTRELLERLEADTIPISAIDIEHRHQLILHPLAEIRRRASALLGRAAPNRQIVVAGYRAALDLAGDADPGSQLYKQHCATCHRSGNDATPLGPDLRALTTRSPESWLESIFDPNRSVEPRYLSHTAVTNDGLILNGILVRDNRRSITLVAPDGMQHTLLRADLEQLQCTGKSMMPEGLEQVLPKAQDVADLLEFLRQKRG
jgi:putative membrane-bound dehydrogenase-like protein